MSAAPSPPAPPHPIKVSVANQQERLEVPPAWLRDVARAVLEGENVRQAKISVALLTDAAIHDVNRRFLQHDEPTDVMSFPMSGPGAKTLEAEILISVDTAATVAAEKKHPALNEVGLYLIHGLLHLCGYDDHSERDQEEMRRLEAIYLDKVGLRLTDYPVGLRGPQHGPKRPMKIKRKPKRMPRPNKRRAAPPGGGS